MAEQVPHEGVPDHLEGPLRRWIYAALQGGGAALVALKLEIRIDYDRAGGNAAIFLARDPEPYELLAQPAGSMRPRVTQSTRQ